MVRPVQASFSRGELAPDLGGRTDINPFYDGVQKGLNCFVHQFGGLSNRPGQPFIAPTKDHSKESVLIPFVFGSTDTHVLEFGDGYMRPLRNDNNIFQSGVAITGITKANPAVVTTSGAHGYSTGNELMLDDILGMVELNGKRVKITVLSGTTFSIADQYTGVNIDSTGFTTYTSGGNGYKVYEIVSPYAEADLPFLYTSQSFDVVYITCEGHPRRKLERLGLTNWQFSLINSEADTQAPASLALTASGGSVTVRYAVTAINTDTEEESAAAPASTSFNISAITKANPCTVTVASVGNYIQTGHEVLLNGIVGMTELNGRRFQVTRLSDTSFQLQGIDSTTFTTYVSGGTLTPTFVWSATGPTTPNNAITWTASPDALRYSVYKEINGVFGLIGETQNTTYTDTGSPAPDTADTLQISRDPFFGTGNNPGVVGEHLQRSVYGRTPNNPARLDFSQVGAADNFNRSIPSKASDAFSLTIDTRGENAEIRHVVSQRDLIVFTNSSIKSLSSGDLPFTLANIKVRGEDRFGASKLPPLVVSKNIVFQEENGERIHGGQFSFAADGFVTEDLTLFSAHLFRKASAVAWANVTWPEPIIHMIMSDGTAIAFTYNPEEQAQVTGLCPWKTAGEYKSVTAVRASAADRPKSVYFIVKRVVNGHTIRVIEKLHNRVFDDPEDCFFVDSGLSFDNPLPIDAITVANPAVFTVIAHGLQNNDIVDISGCTFDFDIDDFGNPITPEDEDGNPDGLALPNGRRFRIANKTTDTFQLVDINTGVTLDSSGYKPYLDGGFVRKTVTALAGFEHLAGAKVVGLIDGNVVRGITIDVNGNVVFPAPIRFSRAHIGLEYMSDIQSLPFELAGRGGLAGRMKKVGTVVLRMLRSRGMLIGSSFSSKELQQWKQREYENYGQPTALFTGDIELGTDSHYSLASTVCLRQRDPLPTTLLQIDPDVIVS